MEQIRRDSSCHCRFKCFIVLCCANCHKSYQSTKKTPWIVGPWPWNGSSSILQNVPKSFHQHGVVFKKFWYSSTRPWKISNYDCWFSVHVSERGLFSCVYQFV